jgi:hypothetical protein
MLMRPSLHNKFEGNDWRSVQYDAGFSGMPITPRIEISKPSALLSPISPKDGTIVNVRLIRQGCSSLKVIVQPSLSPRSFTCLRQAHAVCVP